MSALAVVSEGTRSAQLLLEHLPEEERPPFYIFPRTLEEAFGPGQRHLHAAPEGMHAADKLVVRACGLAAAAMTAVLVLTATAHAQHVDCEKKINAFHPCHRWVDNSGGGLTSAGKSATGAPAGPAAASPGASNNPGGLAGGGPVGGPAAGNPGTAPGTSPGAAPGKGNGKGHGHAGPKGDGKGPGGKGGHGKGGKK